jgi:hypothetical protein
VPGRLSGQANARARGTKATRPLDRGTTLSLLLAFSFFIRGGDTPRHEG